RHVFFLSRRSRHTRLVSDWSSDVCSSDLEALDDRLSRAVIDKLNGGFGGRLHADIVGDPGGNQDLPRTRHLRHSRGDQEWHTQRSEERRVGKEGRKRGER